MYRKNHKKITIAIDGPAASGKTTTAKLVAQKLGYLHIDTGAMYRAVTLGVLDKKLDVNDREKVVQLAQTSIIHLEEKNGCVKVFLNDEDVSLRIRMPVVNRTVSTVSSYAGVREVMVREQRRIASQGGVVLEGRDIGTVVLPQAELKIFMVASVDERARRRMKELAQTGIEAKFEEMKNEIESRDQKDSTRETSPLKKANDAIVLDTSTMTIEEQAQFILARARKIIQQEEIAL